MNAPDNNAQAPQKKSKGFLIVLILLVVGGGAFGFTKYNHAQHHEETDNAHIESNISPVIPRVGGYIKDVLVKDNQRVKKGDTLLVIDDRDLQVRLQQAEAALATAKSNLDVARASTSAATANIASSRASIGTIDAQIETAKVNVWRTTQDFNRYENLIKDHTITQQQYEQAVAAKQTAERQLQVLQEQKRQATSQTSAVASQSGATSQQIGVASAVIKQREADIADVKNQLSYTVITAPADGLISKVGVQAGQLVQPGQALFSIVLNNEKWVIANFKETQLDRMKVGQKVTLKVDAYPGEEFEAQVTSFSPATGSSFALLPPDNATGNFVKVVQRVPIKIEFANPNNPELQQLRAGMNVEVDVHLD
ncbi:membrane fusion protein, multidrug efflux system [Cnuella takakiae]|uniref:Membrane fusion protein, multidrug efflux system n=1 Tax=Cnuella takakiae TaxID=1302690 RepID=A0A1M5I3G7_9BACT|nr:HlyD family secretion protein [Cnuella takakiae]OLY91363.1 secretion protein HlyD [Cnuella takakiae]SHG22443.1 membrane fusion protein, multidrug efflux system [Cnuella takakiae]